MNDGMYAWIHDDITWCAESGDCPCINCMRNTVNMVNRNGLHSYAMFRNTDECPIYRIEQNAEVKVEDMIQ